MMKKMNKYFARLSFHNPGYDSCTLIEADSFDEAYSIAWEETAELAGTFGFEQNDDHFGDLDTVGKDWDEEEEEYGDTGSLDPLVELYDPAKHDGYL
jgi:hypothetical protein